MMFKVETVIAADLEVVWAYLTVPELMEKWMPGLEALRTGDGGPLASGSTLFFEARGAERTSRVIEFAPHEAVVLRSVQGPITATYRYTVKDAGAAVGVTLEARCAARGWAVVIVPLISLLVKMTDGVQLEKLKAAIDGR